MITKATFTGTDWQESALSSPQMGSTDGVGVARFGDRYRYAGAVDGESPMSGTICYLPGGTGTFSSYEQFQGTVDGRHGSCVLHATGTFTAEAIRADLRIVDGSGTGELTGIAGSGTMSFPMGAGNGTVELDYTLEG